VHLLDNCQDGEEIRLTSDMSISWILNEAIRRFLNRNAKEKLPALSGLYDMKTGKGKLYHGNTDL